ncbi:MAG: DUF881 domain-containing protein [Nocardioides sp.]
MPETEMRPRPDLPDQVMMPLLDRIVRQSLDEDYRLVAARSAQREQQRHAKGRRHLPPAPPRVRPRRVAAAVMAVFGVLVGIAAVQTSQNAPEASAGRAGLIDQIQARRATVTRVQGRLDRLQTSIAEERDALAQSTEDGQVLATRIARVGERAGFAAVRGPGVRIKVDDTPDGDLTQEVRGSDLSMLVDGLWAAGAEAIAVNNRRITPLTAFSNVGLAVHLGGIPLVAPYTLEVVGDPGTLAAKLLDSSLGQRFFSLKDTLGFPFEIKRVDEPMSLPAGPLPRRLLVVRQLDDDGGNRPPTDGEVSAP